MATGNILSLRDVVYDMAGTYECMVTVPQLVGMETSAVFQLIVEGKFHHVWKGFQSFIFTNEHPSGLSPAAIDFHIWARPICLLICFRHIVALIISS